MTVVKRSVSIDQTIAEQVERAARQDGVSFSAWLSSLAAYQLKLRAGLAGVTEYEDEHGPLSPAELAVGRTLLSQGLADTKHLAASQ